MKLSNNITKKFFDCQIIFRNETDPDVVCNGHKIILANASSYFEKLFDMNDLTEYVINCDFSVNFGKNIIDKIYKQSVNKDNPETDINYLIDKLKAYKYFLINTNSVIRKIITCVEVGKYLIKDISAYDRLIKFLNEYVILSEDEKGYLIDRLSDNIKYGLSEITDGIQITWRLDKLFPDNMKFKHNDITYLIYDTEAYIDTEKTYGIWIVPGKDIDDNISKDNKQKYFDEEVKKPVDILITIINGLNPRKTSSISSKKTTIPS